MVPWKRFLWVVLLFTFVHGSPLAVNSNDLRRADEGIPSSPPWVYPNDVKPPPSCMALSPADNCPFRGTSSITACSATKCTTTFFGACMQTGTLVDKSCFCTDQLNDQGCSQCSEVRSRTQYLSWLNSTCGDIKNWHGLSQNWTSQIPDLKLIWVGNTTVASTSYYYSSYYYAYPCKSTPASPSCNSTYFTDWNPPSGKFCPTFETAVWNASIYNATEAAVATFQDIDKTYSPWFTSTGKYAKYDPSQDAGLYLDLNGLCRSVYSPSEKACGSDAKHSQLVLWASTKCDPLTDFGWPENWRDSLAILNSSFIEKNTLLPLANMPVTQNCSTHINSVISRCSSSRCKGSTCDQVVDAIELSCLCKDMDLWAKCNPTGLEQTVDFLWLNKTCGTVAEFPGLPGGWQDSLLKMNATYGAPANFTTWPKCANANGCGTTLNDTVTNCTNTLCDIDPKTGVCNSTTLGVKPSCYCSPISFDVTCNRDCKLAWEREQLLDWMNSTCSPVVSWKGLPNNWVDLLQVQDSELLPWNWRIQISASPASSHNSTISSDQQRHCPSTSSKLAAFAAVNAAMALLIPLFGRRDVMKKITFGFFGKRASPMWLATGPLTVVLHITSNAIAALMIKRTPGFGGVDVGQLILLWCTRPRLAWMIIALIPFQASNEIYFSVASSTLIAEILLQVLGGYYMGVATNYARRQKWYEVGRLTRTAKGRDAMIMYAGSVMWLSVIVIAIATCIWSLLGLGKYVTAIGSAIRGLDRQARRQVKSIARRVASLSDQQNTMQGNLVYELELKFPDLALHFDRVLAGVREDLESLGSIWERLEIYVTADTKARKAAEREEKTLEKMARKAGKNGESPPEMPDLTNESSTALITWNSTPGEQLSELQRLKEHFLKKEDLEQQRRLIDDESIAAQRRLHTYQSTLLGIQRKLECLDKAIKRFSSWNAGPTALTLNQRGGRQDRIDREREYLTALIQGNRARPRPNWIPSAVENTTLVSLRHSMRSSESFAEMRRRLIGPNTQNLVDNQTIEGLKSLVSKAARECSRLDKLRVAVTALLEACVEFERESTTLINIWTKQKNQREAEEARRKEGSSALLKKIAIRTIAGMIGCSAAQWVWWVGYVKVAGDSYCPPKLTNIAAVWTVFSLLGGMLGGSF